MKRISALLAGTTMLLAACGDGGAQSEDQAMTPANQTASANPAQTATVVALGLTMEQLDDADIVDASGREIGDVERVVTDASGAVTGLVVEVDDTDPDRHVTLPLEGLTVVQDGNDHDLRVAMTRDQLNALPETKL